MEPVFRNFLKNVYFNQIEDEGDTFWISCDAGVNCMNACDWKIPNNQICNIDSDTNYGDSISCGSNIQFVGRTATNDQGGNRFQTCDIKVTGAKPSQHAGMWTCVSYMLTVGKFVDNVNVTFEQGLVGK